MVLRMERGKKERDCKPKEPLDFRYTKLSLKSQRARRVETLQSGVRHFELSDFLLSHNQLLVSLAHMLSYCLPF